MDPYFTFGDESVLKKERARARKIRASQWWKRKKSTGICYYCKEVFSPAQLTMDHIIPVARGGKSEKFNLVPCCKECNTRKRNLLPSEWDEYMKTIKK
ncbi:MAG: HNH endonuclease [Desulfobacteraceae bacterium 4572_89]|nr:MAG: HNH endonuclease [Desulfobacteraceae bacterium 4572_89]